MHRGSWAYHSTEGWTIGPSLEHYWCIEGFMSKTAAEVDADTIRLIPHAIPIPQFGDTDAIGQAIAGIVHILKQPEKNNIPAVLKGDDVVQLCADIAHLLGWHKTSPMLSQPNPLPMQKMAPPSLFLPPLQVPITQNLPVEQPRMVPTQVNRRRDSIQIGSTVPPITVPVPIQLHKPTTAAVQPSLKATPDTSVNDATHMHQTVQPTMVPVQTSLPNPLQSVPVKQSQQQQ
eukprot:2288485-Ditylum_brightwellii.AAC.1